MIKWIKATDKQPADTQVCFITGMSDSMAILPIIGPIPYRVDMKAFFDFFGTRSAGVCYEVDNKESIDLYWCDEADINLPDEDETET